MTEESRDETRTPPQRGMLDPCTCEGCGACPGHEHGCTCDVDWDEVYRRGMVGDDRR